MLVIQSCKQSQFPTSSSQALLRVSFIFPGVLHVHLTGILLHISNYRVKPCSAYFRGGQIPAPWACLPVPIPVARRSCPFSPTFPPLDHHPPPPTTLLLTNSVRRNKVSESNRESNKDQRKASPHKVLKESVAWQTVQPNVR